MFSSQQYSGFDPRSIPGCQFWLDAVDSNTFTFSSGSNIATWRDKSQNAITGTAVNSPTRVANTINGLPTVEFNGASTHYINYGNNFNLGSGSFYIFAVVKYNNTGSGTIIAKSLYAAGTGRWALGRIGEIVPNAMLLLVDVGGGGFTTSYSDTSTSPQLVCAYSDRQSRYLRQNGTQRGSNIFENNTPLDSTIPLFVGAYQNASGGAPPISAFNLTGNIGEIIVYTGSTLTLFQLQSIEGYLTWKWGLNTSLPTGHVSKSNPVAVRTFQPIDVSGCFLWLDGADARTVGVSGTNVTAWNDKSGMGNNLTTISATPPTYSSTTGAITFTAANQTAIRGALTSSITNPITTFVVCLITSAGVDGGRNLLNFGTSGSSASFFAGQYNLVSTPTGSPAFYTYANNGQNPTGQGINVQTYIPTTYNTIGIFANSSTYSGTNLTNNTFLNGNTSTYSAVNTTWTVASPYVTTASYVAIGNDTAGTGGTGGSFNGNIYEVLAFSKTLSTSERQQIEGYLAAKWGLSSSLPTTQPFYLLRSIPSTPIFTPTALSGLEFWFDAADNSTITTSPSFVWSNKGLTSGSNITVFSGTPISGTVTQNGANLVSLSNGTQLIFTGAFPTQVRTRFIATKPTSSSETSLLFQNRAASSGNDYIGVGTTLLEVAQGVSTNMQSATISSQSNVFNIYTFMNASTSGSNRLAITGSNLTLTTSVAASGYNTASATNYINHTNSQDLGEWISYNRELTTSEIAQVEGYLAWKWGLQNSLPTTHPYYKFRP